MPYRVSPKKLRYGAGDLTFRTNENLSDHDLETGPSTFYDSLVLWSYLYLGLCCFVTAAL